MDPADFYTGLVADLYRPLRSEDPDPVACAEFVRRVGEPALELGCGDGDPLLTLRRAGLDVEGVDSSADMLQRCRRRAAAGGLRVVLHHQRMEALDLPGRYRAIFLAGPTFNLLPDDGAALAALRGIRTHLADGGRALIPLFVPTATAADELGRERTAIGADGAQLRFRILREERDEVARTQTASLRYERRHDGESTVVERPWLLHWYTRGGFTDLAAAADLVPVSVTGPEGSPAAADGASTGFELRAGD